MQLNQLPNILTLSRLGCAVLLGAGLLLHKPPYLTLLIIFLAASLTDFLDGFLARRLNATSKLGASLDHLTDKALVYTVLILLLPLVLVPAWVVWLLLMRDLVILALKQYKPDLPSLYSAKAKMLAQTALVGLMLLHLHQPLNLEIARGIDLLVPITLGLSLISALNYLAAAFLPKK